VSRLHDIMALVVAGATSTAGLTVLVATKLRAKTGAKKTPAQPKSKEKPS
jgi:hypothetical protein